jgi:outer membrane lipopolysaccharide assembly protein LptE/RlpB
LRAVKSHHIRLLQYRAKALSQTPGVCRVALRLPVVAIIICMTAACGYQFAGRGELPGGIQTLSVRILDNRTSESGVETIFTNSLINELNRRRRGSVVEDARADAVLQGSIESLAWETVARVGTRTAAERRVYASLVLTLTDMQGNVLWRRSGLRAEQAYAVVEGNKSATESNRRRAITTLSEQMAETVYRRLTDHF